MDIETAAELSFQVECDPNVIDRLTADEWEAVCAFRDGTFGQDAARERQDEFVTEFRRHWQ